MVKDVVRVRDRFVWVRLRLYLGLVSGLPCSVSSVGDFTSEVLMKELGVL